MAQQMNDEQRLQALEQYNPADHFITIRSKKTGTETQYYPASWRLYELRLHYPHITIESEILHLDQEHNFVIVKAWIFDGRTYAESDHRASGTKQGLLSELDRVETAAKARAARDIGIGTEYALDVESEDEQTAQAEALTAIKAEVKRLGLVRNPQQWAAFKKKAIGRDLPDSKLSAAHITKLNAAIEQHKNNQAA